MSKRKTNTSAIAKDKSLDNKATKKSKNNKRAKTNSAKKKEYLQLRLDIEGFLDAMFDISGIKVSYNSLDNYKKSQVSLNAHFIYSHARLERMLIKLLNYSIKNKKSVRDKYLLIFDKFATDNIINKVGKVNDWKKYINQPRLMVQDFDKLEQEKGSITLLKVLFGIDFKNKFLEHIYKRYVESRERRNLLAHRSKKPDKKYYDKLKYYGIDRNFLREKVFTKYFLWNHTTSYQLDDYEKGGFISRRLDNDLNDPIDLSVNSFYLKSNINNIVCYFFSVLINSEIFVEDDGITPLHFVHDIMLKIVDTKNTQALSMLIYLFNIYCDHKEIEITELPMVEKVNYILLNSELARVRKKKIDLESFNTLIDSIKDEEDREHAPFIKLLLKCYISNDRKGFFEISEKYFSKNKDKIFYMKKWYIFSKYKKTYKPLRELLKN